MTTVPHGSPFAPSGVVLRSVRLCACFNVGHRKGDPIIPGAAVKAVTQKDWHMTRENEETDMLTEIYEKMHLNCWDMSLVY